MCSLLLIFRFLGALLVIVYAETKYRAKKTKPLTHVTQACGRLQNDFVIQLKYVDFCL